MNKFATAMSWLNGQVANQEKAVTAAQEKLERLRSAREVLGEYAPAERAPVARKPRREPRRKPVAKNEPVKVDRRSVIAAAAAKVAPKKAPATTRPCGCAGSRGQHRQGCKHRVTPAAAMAKSEPERTAVPQAIAEAVVASLFAAPAAPPPRLSFRTGRPVKSKGLGERLCRCTVPVQNEFGSGGRGLKKTQPCGETVWAGSRQKHLHAEHGIIDPAIEGYFEALKDPEDANAA